MPKLKSLPLLALCLAAAPISQAGVVLLTAPSAGTYVPDFSAFGTPANNPYSGTLNLASPATANGLTVSDSGNGFYLTLDQFGWGGDFGPGSPVLWNVGGGPDTLTFSTALQSVGVQIDPDTAPGSFTAFITAYDASDNLLGTFSHLGTFAGFTAQDVATFIGVESDSANIAKIVISAGTDFAISGGASPSGSIGEAPEPASTALCALGLVALSVGLRSRVSP